MVDARILEGQCDKRVTNDERQVTNGFRGERLFPMPLLEISRLRSPGLRFLALLLCLQNSRGWNRK